MTKHDDLIDDLVSVAGDALMPFGGPLAKRVMAGLRAEWERNRSVALRAALEESGLSREDFVEAMEADTRLFSLTTRLLYAAGMNGHDATLKALGTVLGEAVRAPDSFEECEIILTSLADLNPTHVLTLRALAEDPPPNTSWSQAGLVEHSGLQPSRVALAIPALVSRGLAALGNAFLGGDLPISVTDLGRRVLEVVDRWAEADTAH